MNGAERQTNKCVTSNIGTCTSPASLSFHNAVYILAGGSFWTYVRGREQCNLPPKQTNAIASPSWPYSILILAIFAGVSLTLVFSYLILFRFDARSVPTASISTTPPGLIYIVNVITRWCSPNRATVLVTHPLCLQNTWVSVLIRFVDIRGEGEGTYTASGRQTSRTSEREMSQHRGVAMRGCHDLRRLTLSRITFLTNLNQITAKRYERYSDLFLCMHTSPSCG